MQINRELTIEQMYNRLVDGIKGYFKSCGINKAVLGLSGGIDSALVAALAVKALGSKNVHGLLLPSEFSTLHSIQDAVDLADNLKMSYNVVSISEIYDRFIKSLDKVFTNKREWSVAEENLQARIRGTILMAYANKYNTLLLNTSNKSELSTGYGTLYGDLAGAIMVIADVYKCDVYELSYYVNMEQEIIPTSTLTKAPSAELRSNQKDTDSLPEYELMDPILYQHNEGGKSFEQIKEEGADAALVDRIKGLVGKSSFKIHQIPPILNISSKPLVYKEKCLL
ncbi:MAG: NAD(+) synthase [Bacteroidales bacterium]|nr:NAD(+) synthase [Bacteroidales bacterium]